MGQSVTKTFALFFFSSVNCLHHFLAYDFFIFESVLTFYKYFTFWETFLVYAPRWIFFEGTVSLLFFCYNI